MPGKRGDGRGRSARLKYLCRKLTCVLSLRFFKYLSSVNILKTALKFATGALFIGSVGRPQTAAPAPSAAQHRGCGTGFLTKIIYHERGEMDIPVSNGRGNWGWDTGFFPRLMGNGTHAEPHPPCSPSGAEFQLQTRVGFYLQFFVQPTCQNSPSTERLRGKRTGHRDKCSVSLAQGARVPSSLTLQLIRGLMDFTAAARFLFKLLPIMANI